MHFFALVHLEFTTKALRHATTRQNPTPYNLPLHLRPRPDRLSIATVTRLTISDPRRKPQLWRHYQPAPTRSFTRRRTSFPLHYGAPRYPDYGGGQNRSANTVSTRGEKLSSQEFIDFLDENLWRVDYSPYLLKFIDQPISSRKVPYRLRRFESTPTEDYPLELLREDIADDLEEGQYYSITKNIEEIGELGTPEAFNFLRECAAGKHWGKGINDRENQIYSSIAYALRHYPTLEAAQLIIDIIAENELYSTADALIALAKITNVDYAMISQQDTLLAPLYTHLFDSLQTLPAIREAGYHLMAEFRQSDYETRTNYLGELALRSRDFWWINYHSLNDLIDTKQPEALTYLGSQLKRGTNVYNDYLGRSEYEIVPWMEELTDLRLEVQDANGIFTSTYQDRVSRTNYAAYWMLHYKDYAWDEATKKFKYLKDDVQGIDTLTQLFERIKGENDSLALQAFMELTEFDPDSVDAKAEQYNIRGFRNVNDALSSFSSRFLPVLTRIVKFCRENEVSYKPNPVWTKALNTINELNDDSERYRMDQDWFAKLTIDDLTPLEYYMIVHEDLHWAGNTSLSWMLDKWYSANWNLIVNDQRQLRLYLKKSRLYDELGIIGNVNKYNRKFNNAAPDVIDILKDLLTDETDEDIRAEILEVLRRNKAIPNEPGETGAPAMLTVGDFAQALATGQVPDLAQVNVDTTKETYRLLFGLLNDEDIEKVTTVTQLIHANLHPAMTPWLLEATNISTVLHSGYISRHDANGKQHALDYNIQVADKMIAYLENLHNYVFPRPADPVLDVAIVSSSQNNIANYRKRHFTAPEWQKLNKESKGDFRSWKNTLFDRKLEDVKTQDSLNIHQVNALIDSDLFQQKDWAGIFQALPRVLPARSLASLKTPDTNLTVEQIPVFLAAEFSPNQLDNVYNIFQDLASQDMQNFATALTDKMSPAERGDAWQSMMWNTSFQDKITANEYTNDFSEKVATDIEAYYETVRRDEFRATHAIKFIEQIRERNTPPLQRLKKMLTDTSRNYEEAVTTILEIATYEQLPELVALFDHPAMQEQRLGSFIKDDWGIPIPGKLDSAAIRLLSDNLQRLSQRQLYEYYLDAYDCNYKLPNGRLNYPAIYEMLEFDIVDGFVGGGGGRRVEHVYGLMRLLELEFNDRLGYPLRFNDLINSMGKDYDGRARKWQQFLVSQKLVLLPKYYVPSISNLK